VVPIRTADVAATLVVRPSGNSLAVVVDPAKLGDVLGASLANLDVEPRNATLDVSSGAVRITPEQAGRRLDLQALARALTDAGALDDDRVVTAPFVDVAPSVTADQIQRLGISEQVATFTTRHAAGESRVRNIHRICDVVDGSIVQPGERFSLNSKAGKRTTAAGYVAAPVIEAGEFTDDVGGGVSQFTTTLYNALWLGGYEIDEHQPHSYWISRYPQGREATLSFPHPDLVFTNNWSTAVLIHCGYDATSITVTLFGDQEGRVVKAEGPEITKPVPAEDQVTDDPTLPEGTEKVLDEHTFDGFDVAWTRTVTAPGRAPAKERFYTHYQALGRKVAHGTGPPESTTTVPGQTTTTGLGGSTTTGPAGGATTTATTAPGPSTTSGAAPAAPTTAG
jgi:vancomycin resistance protein YoaR